MEEEENIKEQEIFEEEPIIKEPIEEESKIVPFKLENYALVATIAKNGLILLYEFKHIDEAKIIAQKRFDEM